MYHLTATLYGDLLTHSQVGEDERSVDYKLVFWNIITWYRVSDRTWR